jgi:hypothetical protein
MDQQKISLILTLKQFFNSVHQHELNYCANNVELTEGILHQIIV